MYNVEHKFIDVKFITENDPDLILLLKENQELIKIIA